MKEVIGVFIPIIFFIVTGLVISIFIYYRSKEKQMMIERNMHPDQFISQKRKKSSTLLLKLGIIVIVFGIFLGLGFYLENLTYNEEWIAVSVFTGLGAGFVTAYFVARRIEKSEEKKEEPEL